MKRFYKSVSVEQNNEGWLILLDGKAIKTKNGGIVCLSSKKTAELIASEWDCVGKNQKINPRAMDYTSLATTAIDKIIPNIDEIKTNLCSYAINELICYREGENKKLIKIQNENWDEELEWARGELNMPLKITTGIIPVLQDDKVYNSAMSICDSMGGFSLTAFADLVGNLGSFVLSWALIKDKLNIDKAFYKANLDEYFQNNQWGEDIERKNILEASKKTLKNSLNFYNSLKNNSFN